MDKDLNKKLKESLLKNLDEYMPQCKESLIRNWHMHAINDVKTWEPDTHELVMLSQVARCLIDGFSSTYAGGDNLGDVANHLIDVAKIQHKVPHAVMSGPLRDAVVVDFLNFWANKHCMDLGFYTRDLTAP